MKVGIEQHGPFHQETFRHLKMIAQGITIGDRPVMAHVLRELRAAVTSNG